MPQSPTSLTQKLIEGGPGGLQDLRVHEFPDDESTHDDDLNGRLHAELSAEFDRVQTQLSESFGAPSRVGEEDDDVIPLNGVFRFAVWDVGDTLLFAAAAHEDRGVPILIDAWYGGLRRRMIAM